jgi:hypothetical protein
VFLTSGFRGQRRPFASFEVLAENAQDDGFDASPALVVDENFLRGYRYLYSIGTPDRRD